MNNNHPHIYSVRCNVDRNYYIAFWSPVTGRCLHWEYIAYVPWEDQMNEITNQAYREILLEDGPSPHFYLYHQ